MAAAEAKYSHLSILQHLIEQHSRISYFTLAIISPPKYDNLECAKEIETMFRPRKYLLASLVVCVGGLLNGYVEIEPNSF